MELVSVKGNNILSVFALSVVRLKKKMSTAKKSGGKNTPPAGRVKPNIPALERELCGRYVAAPLRYWDDKSTEPKSSSETICYGVIIEIHKGKGRKQITKADILFAPYDEEDAFNCNIEVEDVYKMLLPSDWEPDEDTYLWQAVNDKESDEDSVKIVQEATEEEKKNSKKSSTGKRRYSKRNQDKTTTPTSQFEESDSDASSLGFFETHDFESDALSNNNEQSDDDDDTESETSQTEIEEEVELNSEVKVKWESGVEGTHTKIDYQGDIGEDAEERRRKYGMAQLYFFPTKPDPTACFLTFIPPVFIDNIAKWTTKKFKIKKVNMEVDRGDVMAVFCMWFIMGLVQLPSVDIYFKLGIHNILKLIGIESRHEDDLLKGYKYNRVAANLQYNEPVMKHERVDEDGKEDYLYLIRPLLKMMQTNFRRAWIPAVDLTADESLWAFKGRTFLKRFMKDKPKKYGFLEYALCTLGGYFLHIIVHHLPGKAKRKKRKMDEKNLCKENRLQLALQKRYGEQGALVMRLASELENDGHHIVGDNAFSSVQLATDLKCGKCPHPEINIRRCDYTGTQVMQKSKKSKTAYKMNFAEYKNLPEDGWGRIRKYEHEWYSDKKNDVSVVNFHDKKHITLISSKHHGSELSQTYRTRAGKREVVDIPKIVKEYSFKKVGVDVGDQKLRSKLGYADVIRCKGWNRKWAMHGIQQIRHNAFMCWADINEIKTGDEDAAVFWSEDGTGNGKAQWAFQVGLIKGLLARIRQYKRAKRSASKDRFAGRDECEEVHTIVNRGARYSNIRCAVCMHLKKMAPRTRGGMVVRRSRYWCPHPNCRCHVCEDHRMEVHSYADEGISLASYHKMKRVEYSIAHPGKQKKAKNSGRRKHRTSEVEVNAFLE